MSWTPGSEASADATARAGLHVADDSSLDMTAVCQQAELFTNLGGATTVGVEVEPPNKQRVTRRPSPRDLRPSIW